MTNLRTAAQQALEALEYENSWHESFKVRPYASTIDAITALRAALAQQDEPVEPVATLTAQRDALLEALKYHQEQTRPIQRTLDVIKMVEEGK